MKGKWNFGNFSSIMKMAPFLDEESLHELVLAFLAGDKDINIFSLLPFLGRADLKLLLDKIIENDGASFNGLHLAALLPFLGEEDLSALVKKITEGDGESLKGVNLAALLPFLGEKDLSALVKKITEGDGESLKGVNLAVLLPFLGEEDLRMIADKLIESGDENFLGLNFAVILSFLGEEDIDRIFAARAERGKNCTELLPFVSRKSLHKIVVLYCNGEGSNINLDEVYPFLDEDDLKMLFSAYMKNRKS